MKKKKNNMQSGEELSASYCFINYAFFYVKLAICNADFSRKINIKTPTYIRRQNNVVYMSFSLSALFYIPFFYFYSIIEDLNFLILAFFFLFFPLPLVCKFQYIFELNIFVKGLLS